MQQGNLFQIQSTLIVILIFVGLFFRRQRNKHVPIMATAIIWDILLVVQIEWARSAVEKAVQVQKNPLILTIHVLLALSCICCYALVTWTGRRLLKGQHDIRPQHKKWGMVALILRLLTYATSFMI